MGKVVQIKDRRAKKIPLTFIILAFIFIYTLGSTIIYFTRKHVTVYEVNKGSITDMSTFTGFIVRSEELVKANGSGDINYFVYENERVGNSDKIACIDSTGKITSYIEELKDSKTTLRPDAIKSLNSLVSDFKKDFDDTSYNSLYGFRDTLDSNVTMYINDTVLEDLNKKIDFTNSNYNLLKAEKTGIVLYGYDGYENYDASKLKYDVFDKKDYTYNKLASKKSISSSDVAYRLITEQEWTIYIKLTDAQANKYADQNVVSIRFPDSNITTNADFEVYTNTYGVFGKITLNRYVSDYATKRYVDIELNAINKDGLKIPKSAVVSKEFYKLPKSLVYSKDSANKLGVNVYYKEANDKGNHIRFKEIDIYDQDEDNYYIDISFLGKGDYVVNNDQYQPSFTFTETKSVKGVYRVNKGYAVFRKIEIIDENDDFYIIKNTTSYGLSAYDHIVYNGSDVKEKEIIY